MTPKKKNPPAGDQLDAALMKAQIEDLEQQLALLTEENEALTAQLDRDEEMARLKDLAARAQADLQNAKMRMAKQSEESRQFALEQFFIGLLPVLDNIQRAFDHIPGDLQNHEWMNGMQTIEQELWRTLSEAGLQKIADTGLPVDPQQHEVLLTGPGAEGEVVETLEAGYKLKDRVLRAAKVKVGDGTA